MIDRRTFVTALGLLAIPRLAVAQPSGTVPRSEIVLPHWTSSQTFGDPQGIILVMLIALITLFAAMAVFTIVQAFRSKRGRSPRAGS